MRRNWQGEEVDHGLAERPRFRGIQARCHPCLHCSCRKLAGVTITYLNICCGRLNKCRLSSKPYEVSSPFVNKATDLWQVLALSWLLAATAQEFLQSVIFVLVKHPFDCGDRVYIYGNTGSTMKGDEYFVKEISLLYTGTLFIWISDVLLARCSSIEWHNVPGFWSVRWCSICFPTRVPSVQLGFDESDINTDILTEFKKMEGNIVQAPNSYLNTLFILNQRRSG